MEGQGKGIFRSDPSPLHVGKKSFAAELAEQRSRSADVHGHGRKRVDHAPTESHIVVQNDRLCGVETAVQREHAMKTRVDGKYGNRSRCPWNPGMLSARKRQVGKRVVDTHEYNREKKQGRGGVTPQWEGNKAAAGVFPCRDSGDEAHRKKTLARPGSNADSREENWRPTKKCSQQHLVRSQSADYIPPRRASRSPCERTSLWGSYSSTEDPSRANAQGPTERRRSRSFDNTFDIRKQQSSGVKVPAIPNFNAGVRRVHTPYDSNFTGGPSHMEAGKRAEFRPHTRLFSRENSHTKIFGN